MQPIRTAILAYGMSGKIFHAPFLDFLPQFELYAVLERNEKRMQNEYPKVKSFNNIDDLLNDKSIELVIVNTPNNTHADYAKQALLAGKHVLVEKPFAATSPEAQEVFDLGKKLNKKVLVYQNRRWSSDFLATKEVINSGKLGNIIEMHLRFDRYRPEIGPKKFKEDNLPASGILYDLGAHLLDQAICLFGTPEDFKLVTGAYRKGSKVDDYANLHLQFKNQINVFITTSLLVADPQAGIVVHGTKGSFIKTFCDTQENHLLAGGKITDEGFGEELSGNEGTLTVYNNGLKEISLVDSLKGKYSDLFKSVYHTIRDNIDFPVKEAQIVDQLRILETSEV